MQLITHVEASKWSISGLVTHWAKQKAIHGSVELYALTTHLLITQFGVLLIEDRLRCRSTKLHFLVWSN